MTNLRCIKHKEYIGTKPTEHGCWTCLRIWTQAQIANNVRMEDEVHMGMQRMQTSTSRGQKDGRH